MDYIPDWSEDKTMQDYIRDRSTKEYKCPFCGDVLEKETTKLISCDLECYFCKECDERFSIEEIEEV